MKNCPRGEGKQLWSVLAAGAENGSRPRVRARAVAGGRGESNTSERLVRRRVVGPARGGR
jgi:hypothetical protein